MRAAWAWGVVGLCGLWSACAGGPRSLPAGEEGPYRIGREDVLDVVVWRNAELSRVVPVRPDGFVSLPMVGEVKAEGLTAEGLARALEGKLAPYLQGPRVSVILHEVNAARVFVTGEVLHPGAYPLRGRMTVVQALALAGGLSPFADSESLLVIRTGASAGRYVLRYSELVGSASDGRPAPEAWLQPGDTLVVP